MLVLMYGGQGQRDALHGQLNKATTSDLTELKPAKTTLVHMHIIYDESTNEAWPMRRTLTLEV